MVQWLPRSHVRIARQKRTLDLPLPQAWSSPIRPGRPVPGGDVRRICWRGICGRRMPPSDTLLATAQSAPSAAQAISARRGGGEPVLEAVEAVAEQGERVAAAGQLGEGAAVAGVDGL